MIRALALVLAAYLAVIAQDFLPSMPFFAGAHVLLLPIVVCYALLWMPFPAALAFALYAGLIGDLASVHLDGDRVEIGLGWSMLYYVLVAAALHLPRRPWSVLRWETHCLVSAGATYFLLAAQYLMVCLRRGNLLLDGPTFLQLLGSALAVLLLAPLFYFFFGLFPAGRQHPRVGRVKR